MDYVYAPPTVKVEFSLEPSMNAVESLSLLTDTNHLSGLNPWIYETANAMSPELRRVHEVVMRAAWACVRPNFGMPDFPSFINWLSNQEAVVLRNRAFSWMDDYLGTDLQIPDMDTLVSDVNIYLDVIQQIYTKKHAEKGFFEELDLEPYRQAHALLKDADTFKQTVISHLQMMWLTIVKPEWERKLPMLNEALDAFQHMEYNNLTGIGAVRAVTGRDVSNLDWEWEEQTIVFVPSPHVGPYLNRFFSEDRKTSWIVFGVRLPEGSRVRSADLSRSELNVRLSALADDTRLRILELVAVEGELCAQDIITMLDLSQSAASRNLRQLTATGYLVERRRETAKCYSLNRDRIDDTLKALRRFFRTRL
jgi:ArsR family transcriptional regulator